MRLSQKKILFVACFLFSFSACRTTTRTKSEARNSVGSTSTDDTRGNSVVKSADASQDAAASFAGLTENNAPKTPPVPIMDGATATVAQTLSSSDDITKLTCIKATSTDLDLYDTSFMFEGKVNGNILNLDVSTTTSTTRYEVSSNGKEGEYVTFKSTNTSPKMSLKIATSTQNIHKLYAGTAIVSTPKGDVTTNLSCDVNNQFRVHANDRVKGYKASN